jgi:hypothetical protein
LCKSQYWSAKTSSSVVESHFQSAHYAVWKLRPRRESPPTQTISDAFSNADKNAAFNAVVELFIHHPALPLSLCGSKYFRKVLKGTCRVTRKSVRKAIIVQDLKSLDELKEFLRGKKIESELNQPLNIVGSLEEALLAYNLLGGMNLSTGECSMRFYTGRNAATIAPLSRVVPLSGDL